MNIRSISSRNILTESKEKVEAQKEIRKDLSVETQYHDREGQGKKDFDERDFKRELSEEEWKQALSLLEDLPNFKQGLLRIRVQTINDKKVLLIEDSSGKLIRRMVDVDLFSLLYSKNKVTGQILDKSA